jgi:hypothetical protein
MSRHLPRHLLLSCALALGLMACQDPNDLDQPCRLMRPDQNGNLQVVHVGDTDSSGKPIVDPNFDFLSTGNSDCENLFCIRIHGTDNTRYDDSDGNVHGHCSNACIDVNDCGQKVQGLVCQQLAFDQAFINRLCGPNGDANTCQATFGGNTSATYCINPNLEPQ